MTGAAALIINTGAALAVLVAVIVDRRRAAAAFTVAARAFLSMAPIMALIIVAGALILAFLDPNIIARVVGESSGAGGLLAATVTGAVVHIPAIVAFPLVGSLVHNGAAAGPALAFITSLTMVGFISFPYEARELGFRFALTRNALAVAGAAAVGAAGGLLL